jgi:hypothetical protein
MKMKVEFIYSLHNNINRMRQGGSRGLAILPLLLLAVLIAAGFAAAQQGHPWGEIILPENDVWLGLDADTLDGYEAADFFAGDWWDDSGSDIYNLNPGGVGIGTLTPAAKLDVAGDVLADNLKDVHCADGQMITGFDGSGHIICVDWSHIFSWKYGEWGDCSSTCGPGTETRSVWCERNDGQAMTDESLCTGAKPDASRGCCIEAGEAQTCAGGKCGTHADSCGCGKVYDCGGCTSPDVCYNGYCCTPDTCASEGYACGTHDDGCGGTIACGSCGDHAYCSSDGTCECDSGYGNCDDDWSDGCDYNLDTNVNHCGGCDYDCGSHTYCSDGSCRCDDGYTACDGNRRDADGCECHTGDGSHDCVGESCCTNHYTTGCRDDGNIYWVDSCGNWEEKKRDCECGCFRAPNQDSCMGCPCGDTDDIKAVRSNGAIYCRDGSSWGTLGSNPSLGSSGLHCMSGTYDWRCDNVYYYAPSAPMCGSYANCICPVTFEYFDATVSTYTQCQCGNNVQGTPASFCSSPWTCADDDCRSKGCIGNEVWCYDSCGDADHWVETCSGYYECKNGQCQFFGCTCFVAGTEVTMADGSKKRIEDVGIGERVLGQGGTINAVVGLGRPAVGTRSTFLINGRVEVTPEHPLLTREGWKVPDLELFHYYQEEHGVYNGLEPAGLGIGDILITETGEEAVSSLEELHARPPDEVVYELMVDGDHTYIAGGFVTRDST